MLCFCTQEESGELSYNRVRRLYQQKRRRLCEDDGVSVLLEKA